eukprot:2552402-Rhodomonas_salina.1
MRATRGEGARKQEARRKTAPVLGGGPRRRVCPSAGQKEGPKRQFRVVSALRAQTEPVQLG